jgi:vanillate O-demethylase ferredoxin subunit
MSHIYPLEAREVLNQIVTDPRFRKLNTAPTYGFQVIAFFLLGLTFFLGTLFAYFQGVLPYVLFVPINGYSMVIMFTGIHEATHRSVSTKDWLNDAIGTIGGFLYMPGMSTTLYRYLHLNHHRYTGDPKKDPDVQYANGPFLICLSR